jgi:peptidoglycan-associated lipoprotein
MTFRSVRFWGFGILALALTGCPPKKQVVETEPEIRAEEPGKTQVEEPSLRGKEYKEVPELSAVSFDLDSSSLRADARDALQKNFQTLKQHTDWEVLVEGHCDERGTTEYNLGLGQKRAASVRQYYMTLGLSGTRIATISYGKENPVCSESNESCWAQNRRGVTKVRINPDSK